MTYTLNHDDGQSTHDLSDADIVLVGVSRTSRHQLVSILQTVV